MRPNSAINRKLKPRKKANRERSASADPKLVKAEKKPESAPKKKPIKEEDFAKLKLRMEMKLRAKKAQQMQERSLDRFHLGHPDVDSKCFFFNRNKRCNDDLWRIDHQYKI